MRYLRGMVCRKNLLYKTMSKNYTNPKILLMDSLEYCDNK